MITCEILLINILIEWIDALETGQGEAVPLERWTLKLNEPTKGSRLLIGSRVGNRASRYCRFLQKIWFKPGSFEMRRARNENAVLDNLDRNHVQTRLVQMLNDDLSRMSPVSRAVAICNDQNGRRGFLPILAPPTHIAPDSADIREVNVS